MSEHEDTDGYGSYFTDEENGDPFWTATYYPFGLIAEDFESKGITIGDPNDNGIVWTVPFRFPGQYADPELDDLNDGWDMIYNWNRYYIPSIGRYNRADPLTSFFKLSPALIQKNLKSSYLYASNNPMIFIDESGLQWDALILNPELQYQQMRSTNEAIEYALETIPKISVGYVIQGTITVPKIGGFSTGYNKQCFIAKWECEEYSFAGPSEGLSFGASFEGVIAYSEDPYASWAGPTSALQGGYGYVSGSYFSGTDWSGISCGPGLSPLPSATGTFEAYFPLSE